MRIPFFSIFISSPFDDHRQEVTRFEHEADEIKRRIRGHLPKGVMLPIEKFQLFRYLREQDAVLDAVQESLKWLSFRAEASIPESVEKELFLLVDSVIEPIEELAHMVGQAHIYFRNFSEKQRRKVKEIISNMRQMEHDADQREFALIQKIFATENDPVVVFHLVRLAETIGSIADHAENTGDMMRAMLAK